MNYDQWLLSLCLWREARNQPIGAMRGIKNVIQNRARDGRWPHTVSGIILQPKQFSSFNASDPNATKYPRVDSSEWTAFEACMGVACEPYAGDVTNGANHYHNCPSGHYPSWHDEQKVTAKIGAFWFLKL